VVGVKLEITVDMQFGTEVAEPQDGAPGIVVEVKFGFEKVLVPQENDPLELNPQLFPAAEYPQFPEITSVLFPPPLK
jgi:hypothetical protein